MRIFWHQSGLHLAPESEADQCLLVRLSETTFRWGHSDRHKSSGPGESTTNLGGQELFDLVARDQKISPGSLAGEPDNKKAIIGINEAPKIVSKLYRLPIGP